MKKKLLIVFFHLVIVIENATITELRHDDFLLLEQQIGSTRGALGKKSTSFSSKKGMATHQPARVKISQEL
jgi:hypothetical protein